MKKFALFSTALAVFAMGTAKASIVGEGMLWAGDFGQGIWTVDIATGAFTKKLDVNVGSSVINDLAFNQKSGLLYGISGGRLYGTPNTLFTIDLNSSSLTVKLLGVINTPDVTAHSISGLAFANDVLYATQWNGQRDALFTINTADLSIGNVYYLPSPVNYNVSDLASPYHSGSPLALHSSSNIFEIKSPTGPISIIGNASIPSVQYGLAYAPDRGMMYTTGSDRIVWEINPLTMSSRVVASPFGGGLAALEYVPYAPVPEPATQALFAIGIVLLGAGAMRTSQARNLLHPSNDRRNDA